MLVHMQCGGIVRLNKNGEGKCPVCGKEISIRLSDK